GDGPMHGRPAAILQAAPEVRARRAQHVDLGGENGLLTRENHLAVVSLEVIASSPFRVVRDQGVPSRASIHHSHFPASPLVFGRGALIAPCVREYLRPMRLN